MNTLREAVTNYLAMRRALGFKMHKAGRELFDFILFLEKKGASYITISLALEWAQLPVSVQVVRWAERLGFVRGFARYRSATDSRTEIPPYALLPYKPKRFRPYLYTDHGIKQLLEAALHLHRPNGLKRWSYYCLFGLLAVTGLRISEAIGLKTEDIDLANGIITVRGSKLGKSRLIPIHASTKQVLSDYKALRDQFLNGRPAPYFFSSEQGTRLDYRDVGKAFLLLSRQIGFRKPGASTGPRIHDFRHRFATETMLQWYRNGENVESRLPVLSTFLGHVHVRDTYWYLTLCPGLMGEAVKLLEQRWEVKQ
ncbi:MAG: tyrosine-type recombinase/integrase [Acidobacteriota bacterium]